MILECVWPAQMSLELKNHVHQIHTCQCGPLRSRWPSSEEAQPGPWRGAEQVACGRHPRQDRSARLHHSAIVSCWTWRPGEYSVDVTAEGHHEDAEAGALDSMHFSSGFPFIFCQLFFFFSLSSLHAHHGTQYRARGPNSQP